MIEPVNFMETEILALSYRRMAYLVGFLMAILLSLVGFLIVQQKIADYQTTQLLHEVDQLKVEREKRVAERAGGIGQVEERVRFIREAFEKAPPWSLVLQSLNKLMPAGVWLVSVKSYHREGSLGGPVILLSGEAEDARQISLFLNELSASRKFLQPLLTESKQESRGTGKIYLYTVETELNLEGGF